MCLIVSNIHPIIDEIPQPFIAQEDLVVYKILEKNKYLYRTPYRHKIVLFLFGKHTYKHVHLHPKKTVDEHGCKLWEVHEGIHSYESIPWYQTLNGECSFKAIIPKGAKFYIGITWDIVSSDLIVYKDRKKIKGKRIMTDFIKKLLQDAKNS